MVSIADRSELLAWVEARTGSTVADSRPLLGGMSSVVLRCDLADGRAVVVRHIDDTEWLEREPLLIHQESTALEVVAARGTLTTPEVLATDEAAGLLLMTFVVGELQVQATELRKRAGAMAAAAASIAATPLPADHGLPAFRPWVPDELAPPTWGTAALWQHAIDRFHERVAALSIEERGWTLGRGVLLHRDYHPLNLLWNEGVALPTVVDWVNACVGHPHAELGHCRWNLVCMAGLDVADAFLGNYLEATSAGENYDIIWDLVSILSIVGEPEIRAEGWMATGREDLTSERVVPAIEGALREILDR